MIPQQANREKALAAAVAQIEKKHGKGSVMKLTKANIELAKVQAVSTGSLALDIALGVGGLPQGRIIEVFGPESSGKTTLTLHAIAEHQKVNKQCVFIDAEHALDPQYARNLGVNIEELLIVQPDNGEDAIDIAEDFIRSQVVDLIVIDSVAALIPKAELEGDMEDLSIGGLARLMSKAMRKLTAAITTVKSECTVVFINQLRNKIGVMFGNPETTTGGTALKYFASVRLDVRAPKSAQIKEKDEVVGGLVTVTVVKNKVAPPYRKAIIEIRYGKGISRDGELVELAEKFRFLQKAGSWYSYNGNRLGQGRDSVIKFLLDNPSIALELEQKIRIAAKNDIWIDYEDVTDDSEQQNQSDQEQNSADDENYEGSLDQE